MARSVICSRSMVVDDMVAKTMAEASALALAIWGGSASTGRREATRLTASRTSLAAASRSRLSLKLMEMRDVPSRLDEDIWSMPWMPATCCSMIWVIRSSTTSAEAPV